jgi:peptide/nickel transport system substrate-binding protein
MLEVPPTEFVRVTAAPRIEGIRLRSGRFFDLVMANNVPPFNDARVRKALQLSLDREALVRDLVNDYGLPGGDTPIMPAYRYYSPQPPIVRNVGQARRLLASAGYKSGIELTLVASDRPAMRLRLTNAVSEMAREAGFNIRVQRVNSETYLQQIWTKASFYVGFYNMQPSEDHILSLLYTSSALWNQTRWNNTAFDELVEAARGTQDGETRADYYSQAQSQMRSDVPSIIPLFIDLLAARRKMVAGLHLAPLGVAFHLEEAWIDDSLETDG